MAFLNTIDGLLLREMVLSGVMLLEKNKQVIDALNVFPVPDGDTGTNMSLTMLTTAKELRKTQSASAAEVSAVVAQGALMGARGNSGVILSQLYRGFSQGLEGLDTVDAKTFAAALLKGSEAAYKAVMKPKEGTILTVARYVAEKAVQYAQEGGDLYGMMDNIIQWGEEILAKTTDMLPVLKQAGVVDAGGQGLLMIYRGYRATVNGENIEDIAALLGPEDKPGETEALGAGEHIEFGYCTEFLVKNMDPGVQDQHIDRLRQRLSDMGDCVLVVGDTTLVKVHVHTNNPGQALQLALKLGELDSIKIDNMRQQHQHLHVDEESLPAASEEASGQKPGYERQDGIVAVCAGTGIEALFRDLGASQIVQGGQTMNPSTEDIIAAARRTNARNVFILPNNPNIVLAARQAAELSNGQKIYVIPTTTIPQGVAALVPFMPGGDPQANIERMTQGVAQVKSASVTFAVRDSLLDGQAIQKDDIMGMLEGKLACVGKDVDQVALELAQGMLHGESETVTLFYGDQVTRDQADTLAEKIAALAEDCDVDVIEGGQPLYYYLLSVE